MLSTGADSMTCGCRVEGVSCRFGEASGNNGVPKKKENTNNYSLGNSCAWHTDLY
jgi:hypothetical protein